MSQLRWGSVLSRLSSTLAKESPTLVSQESQAATRLPKPKVRKIRYMKGAASYICILPVARAARKANIQGRLSSKRAASIFRVLPIAKAARKVDTQGVSSSKVATGKVAASYFPINLPVAKEAQKVDTEGSDSVVPKAEIVTPDPTSVSAPKTSSLVQPTLPVSSDFERNRPVLIPPAICDQIVANLNLDITVPGEVPGEVLGGMRSDGPFNILYMAPHKESQLSRYLARAIHGANLSKPKALTAALKDHTFTQSYRFGNPANNNFAAFTSLGTAAREKAVNWAKNRRAKVTTHFASPFSALPCVRDLLEYNHGQYFFDVDIHGNYTKTPPRHWQTLTAPFFNHAVHAMLGEPATTRNTILLAAMVKPKGHIVFLLPNSEGLEHVIRQILDHGLPLRLLSAKEVDIEPSLHGGRHQTVEIHSRLTLPSKQQLTNIYDSFWRERMMHSSAADAQITIARSASMKDWGSHFIATFRRLPNAIPADSTVGLLNLYETLYGFPQKDSHERPVSDQDVDDAKDQDDDDDGALRTALERTQSFTAAFDPSSIDVDALKGEIARLENVISKMQTKMAKTPE